MLGVESGWRNDRKKGRWCSSLSSFPLYPRSLTMGSHACASTSQDTHQLPSAYKTPTTPSLSPLPQPTPSLPPSLLPSSPPLPRVLLVLPHDLHGQRDGVVGFELRRPDGHLVGIHQEGAGEGLHLLGPRSAPVEGLAVRADLDEGDGEGGMWGRGRGRERGRVRWRGRERGGGLIRINDIHKALATCQEDRPRIAIRQEARAGGGGEDGMGSGRA